MAVAVGKRCGKKSIVNLYAQSAYAELMAEAKTQPVPVVLLARLAVDIAVARRGLAWARGLTTDEPHLMILTKDVAAALDASGRNG
jgi:hypothetical protein